MFESERVSVRTVAIAAISFVAITIALTVVIEAVGADRLRALVESAGPWAPLAYVLVRALTFVIAPLSSGPLGFTAGIMFGLWPGLVLTLIAEVVGGSINFWIARKLGQPVIRRIIGQEGSDRIERFYEYASSPWMLVYARLFFFSVYDFISYAAGLTTIRYRHYVVITVVAGIVPAGIAVGIGASLTGDPARLVILYLVLALISAVTLLLYGRVRRLLPSGSVHIEDRKNEL
ncbi:MAG: VTT domain-containing protein [Chloroflexota bacterium]